MRSPRGGGGRFREGRRRDRGGPGDYGRGFRDREPSLERERERGRERGDRAPPPGAFDKHSSVDALEATPTSLSVTNSPGKAAYNRHVVSPPALHVPANPQPLASVLTTNNSNIPVTIPILPPQPVPVPPQPAAAAQTSSEPPTPPNVPTSFHGQAPPPSLTIPSIPTTSMPSPQTVRSPREEALRAQLLKEKEELQREREEKEREREREVRERAQKEKEAIVAAAKRERENLEREKEEEREREREKEREKEKERQLIAAREKEKEREFVKEKERKERERLKEERKSRRQFRKNPQDRITAALTAIAVKHGDSLLR